MRLTPTAPAPATRRAGAPRPRRARALATVALAVGIGAAAAGCADVPVAPAALSARPAALRLSANVAGTTVALLAVTVTAADIPTPLTFNLAVRDGGAQGTLVVPPGAARAFAVQAFDAAGRVTHDGQAAADVARGHNPTLAIHLYPRAGQVPLDVTLGDYSVSVTPAAVTVAAGGRAQLSARLVTAAGDTLVRPVAWATLDPSVALVDSGGNVTARRGATGQARVVAVAGGLAGVAVVTVVRDGAPPDTVPRDTVPRDPTPRPPAETHLVLSRMANADLDARFDLYRVNEDGTGLARITSGGASDETPDLTPDRRRVAFVRQPFTGGSAGRLHVVNADGTGLRAFFADRGTEAGEDLDPAWSPDGTRLAFVSNRTGRYELYVANADGSGLRQVTDRLRANETAWDALRDPAWSPDGRRVVLSAYKAVGFPGRDILALDLATGGADGIIMSEATEASPAWSRDGAWILWTRVEHGLEQIYFTDSAFDVDRVQLSDAESHDQHPVWSPDGARVAFVRKPPAGVARVHLADRAAGGNAPRPLPGSDGFVDGGVSWR
jgi:Tol biopolymer transport system component